MGAIKLTGIVLDSFDYEESDKIVTIYSDKLGKISFIAMGVNKPESKNKYSLLTFSKSEFEIFKSRHPDSLSKLKTGNLLVSNLKISQTYNNYLYTSIITKIILQATNFREKNFALYSILEKALTIIKDDDSPFTVLCYFLFYAMKYFGGGWLLNSCIRCKHKSKVYRLFSFEEYGLICPNCQLPNEKEQRHEFINFLQNLHLQTFNETIQTQVEISFLIVLAKALLDYYKTILGIINTPLIMLEKMPVFQPEVFMNYTYSVLTNFN